MSRKKPAEITEPVVSDTVPEETVVATPEPTQEPQLFDADSFVVDREKFRVVLSSAGGSVQSFFLKEYDVNIVPEDKHLFVTTNDGGVVPLFRALVTHDSIVFLSDDLPVRKVYHFNHADGFQLTSYAADEAERVLSLRSGLRVTEEKNRNEDLRHFNVYLKNEKVEKITGKIKDEFSYAGTVDWFALRSKYFVLVVNSI